MKNATIEWGIDGNPRSKKFHDIYFSNDNGIEESKFVFLKQNSLCERFAKLRHNHCFTIIETGFGTGLNFLTTWDLFEKTAPSTTRLHFISIEKYPLIHDDLKKALQLWPSLTQLSVQLINAYPRTFIQEPHHMIFNKDQIKLSLIFDDVKQALQKINGTTDAWFLDGFAPKLNPEMWEETVYTLMHRLSHKQTTYATFTSARMVRDGLEKAGFSVSKIPGFGKKRHMIRGAFIPTTKHKKSNEPIWLKRIPSSHTERKAIVIGAGIAGCSTAIALAKRGWQVIVIDKESQIATQTSGNPQGVLYTRLPSSDTPLSELLITGLIYTNYLLKSKFAKYKDMLWNLDGIIQIAFDAKEEQKQIAIINRELGDHFATAINKDDFRLLSGFSMPHEGLHLKMGGWVSPKDLCKTMMNLYDIEFHPSTHVEKLEYINNHWQVVTHTNKLKAPIVVLANNYSVKDFSQTAFLPIKTIRGQITLLQETKASSYLKVALSGQSYITPAKDGYHCIGASHQLADEDTSIRIQDHQYNLSRLKKEFINIYNALQGDTLDASTLKGKAGVRCSTTDYLPIVGPVADEVLFNKDYARLSKDAKTLFTSTPAYHHGLYLNIAHGSRGLVTAPLCGELLGAWINGEVLPVSNRLMHKLHPNRFLAKRLIKCQK